MKSEKFQHEVLRVKSCFFLKLNYVEQFILQGRERNEV